MNDCTTTPKYDYSEIEQQLEDLRAKLSDAVWDNLRDTRGDRRFTGTRGDRIFTAYQAVKTALAELSAAQREAV